MTIDEDTGATITCPICGAQDYWTCNHLVAKFDRTFLECTGGVLYDYLMDFEGLIEAAAVHSRENDYPSRFQAQRLSKTWADVKESHTTGDDDISFDAGAMQNLLIEILEDAGAEDLPGSLLDPGAPGMTSTISLLFAEDPESVVKDALERLQRRLANDRR